MRKEASNLKKEEPEVFANNACGRYQKFLWDLMERPDTSVAAKARLLGYIRTSGSDLSLNVTKVGILF